jgi:holo-[acyl-carrier protein] synthase
MTKGEMYVRISCGIDTIRISRIGDLLKRKGDLFLNRVYTPEEQAYCLGKGKRQVESLAARFAAKEAVSKALGTGIGVAGVRFADIEILSDDGGKPVLYLHGKAEEYYVHIGGAGAEISMSHDADQAVAMCVMQFHDISDTSDLRAFDEFTVGL